MQPYLPTLIFIYMKMPNLLRKKQAAYTTFKQLAKKIINIKSINT